MRKNYLFISLATTLLIIAAAAPSVAWISPQDQALMIYAEARNLVLDGKFQEAITVFESLVDLYPDSRRVPDSLYYIGYCNEQLDNEEEAWKHYTEVLEKYDRNLVVYRRAFDRTSRMARNKAQAGDDSYIAYLRDVFSGKNEISTGKVVAAINLARAGDLSAKNVLIRGLEIGTPAIQIHISDALKQHADDADVRTALRQTIIRKSHPLVRVNAIAGLGSGELNEPDRQLIVSTLSMDNDELVRATAAKTLFPYLDKPEVKQAFTTYLDTSNNPGSVIFFGTVLTDRNQHPEFNTVLRTRLKVENDPQMKFAITRVLDSDLDDEEEIMILSDLSESPEEEVRVNALQLLRDKTDNPAVRFEFIERFESDPSNRVRLVALTGLKDSADSEQVTTVILNTMKSSNDPVLVSTSAHIVAKQIAKPEVRDVIISVFSTTADPVLASQLSEVILANLEYPDLEQALVSVLAGDRKSFDVKYAVLLNVVEASPAQLKDELAQLSTREQHEVLQQLYEDFLHSDK